LAAAAEAPIVTWYCMARGHPPAGTNVRVRSSCQVKAPSSAGSKLTAPSTLALSIAWSNVMASGSTPASSTPGSGQTSITCGGSASSSWAASQCRPPSTIISPPKMSKHVRIATTLRFMIASFARVRSYVLDAQHRRAVPLRYSHHSTNAKSWRRLQTAASSLHLPGIAKDGARATPAP